MCRCMHLSLSVCLSVCMSVCLSVCLSACLPVYQYLPALHTILPPRSTQACSTGIRDLWVQEIRRLLQDQFTLMKGTLIRISSLSSPNPSFLLSPLLPLLLSPSPLLLSPCLCRQGNCIWCSEQSYLPWQN